MGQIIRIIFIMLLAMTCLNACDRPEPVDDLDRQEEVPVDDTFNPMPTDIP